MRTGVFFVLELGLCFTLVSCGNEKTDQSQKQSQSKEEASSQDENSELSLSSVTLYCNSQDGGCYESTYTGIVDIDPKDPLSLHRPLHSSICASFSTKAQCSN